MKMRIVRVLAALAALALLPMLAQAQFNSSLNNLPQQGYGTNQYMPGNSFLLSLIGGL